jgi:hypothetical protein
MGGLSFGLDFDEPDHLATIELIRQAHFHFSIRDMPSATSPLFLILASLVSLPFRELSVPVLRSFVCILGSVSLFAIYRTLVAKRAPSPWITCVLLSVHPDYLWYCFMLMTEIPSLLWGVLALRVLSAGRLSGARRVIGGVLCAASVWTRQLWLFLPVSLALTKLPWGRALPALSGERKLFWSGIVGVALSIPLFLIWGGFSPPIRYATPHDLRLTLAQPALGLLLMGAYFPVLALGMRWTWKNGLVFLLACVAALFAPADFVQSWRKGEAIVNPMGPIVRALLVLGKFVPAIVIFLLVIGLIGLGAVVLMRMLQAARSAEYSSILVLAMSVLTLQLLFVHPAWERYWMAFVLMAVVLAERTVAVSGSGRAVRYVMRGQLLFMGVGYYVYQRLTS